VIGAKRLRRTAARFSRLGAFVSCLGLLGVSALAPAASAKESPVAIVAEVKGAVSVRPRGESAPLTPTFGAPLHEGDRVSVGASGKATLLMNDGQLIELGPGSSMKLGKLAESARGSSTIARVARDAGASSMRWTARRASAGGAARETACADRTTTRSSGRSTRVVAHSRRDARSSGGACHRGRGSSG
jgi:hypothetical protein